MLCREPRLERKPIMGINDIELFLFCHSSPKFAIALHLCKKITSVQSVSCTIAAIAFGSDVGCQRRVEGFDNVIAKKNSRPRRSYVQLFGHHKYDLHA